MKLIIAGSRGINLFWHVSQGYSLSGMIASEIVTGMCPDSPDMLAIELAKLIGVPWKEFPSKWRDRDGIFDPKAGFRRNVEMARYVAPLGGLLAIWDGSSPGTRHMIETARRKRLEVYIHKV